MKMSDRDHDPTRDTANGGSARPTPSRPERSGQDPDREDHDGDQRCQEVDAAASLLGADHES
jgi:hypothetical protein